MKKAKVIAADFSQENLKQKSKGMGKNAKPLTVNTATVKKSRTAEKTKMY